MNRQDRVQCQCCRKMMVPRIIVVPGWLLHTREVKQVCPFCMTEDWDVSPNSRGENWGGIAFTLLLVGFCMFFVRAYSGALGMVINGGGIILFLGGVLILCNYSILRNLSMKSALSFLLNR